MASSMRAGSKDSRGGGRRMSLPAFAQACTLHSRCGWKRMVCPSKMQAVPRMIAADVDAAVSLVELFKGVVIGPTVNEIAAAVAGGTVGVMGTLMVLEVGRARARVRKQCPYCRGSGRLACGQCCTIGATPSRTSLPSAQKDCTLCASSGYVECNHCDGEGRLLPIEYERALRAQYEDYVYTANDYYQDGPPYL